MWGKLRHFLLIDFYTFLEKRFPKTIKNRIIIVQKGDTIRVFKGTRENFVAMSYDRRYRGLTSLMLVPIDYELNGKTIFKKRKI